MWHCMPHLQPSNARHQTRQSCYLKRFARTYFSITEFGFHCLS